MFCLHVYYICMYEHYIYMHIYIFLIYYIDISILIGQAGPLLTQRRAEQREQQQQEETAAMIKAEAIKAGWEDLWELWMESMDDTMGWWDDIYRFPSSNLWMPWTIQKGYSMEYLWNAKLIWMGYISWMIWPTMDDMRWYEGGFLSHGESSFKPWLFQY